MDVAGTMHGKFLPHLIQIHVQIALKMDSVPFFVLSYKLNEVSINGSNEILAVIFFYDPIL